MQEVTGDFSMSRGLQLLSGGETGTGFLEGLSLKACSCAFWTSCKTPAVH